MKISLLKKSPGGFAEIIIKEEKSGYRLIAGSKESLVVGIESARELNRRKFILLARRIIRLAKENGFKKISLGLDSLNFPKLGLSLPEMAEILVQNMEMANFDFVQYKTAPKEGWRQVAEVALVAENPADLRKAVERGLLIGQEINSARTFENTPGEDMTPAILADKAKKTAANLSIKITVFNKKDMQKMGMRAVLAVGRGSQAEPRFIVMEYSGGKGKPVVLVGKGITFDSGGINLKPSEALSDMHMDMSGGAAVIHAIVLAAKLKLKKNIVAIIPAAENSVSGSSLRPGDILKPFTGPSIEIKNTDAEGRLILADALGYAEKFKPQLVIDVATLTGAAIVALGDKASAIMTPDENLEKDVRRWGEESGDYVWPLPLWEEYYEYIKGDFADIANIGKKDRCGGAITGGMFLYQYAKNYPWLHIDIAPTMTPSDTDELAKGATGSPIRLLLKIIENYRGSAN